MAGHGRDNGPGTGEQTIFSQDVPINIVLIGYDEHDVGPDIRAQLPRRSQPVDRIGLEFGSGRDLGLRFHYRYRIVDAPKRFEDQFFTHLTRSATVGDLTVYQQFYNDQVTDNLDVKAPVLALNGPETVDYLEDTARAQLGVPTARGYTAFLVNWWGRDASSSTTTARILPPTRTRVLIPPMTTRTLSSRGAGRTDAGGCTTCPRGLNSTRGTRTSMTTISTETASPTIGCPLCRGVRPGGEPNARRAWSRPRSGSAVWRDQRVVHCVAYLRPPEYGSRSGRR